MPEIDPIDMRLNLWLVQHGLRGNPFAAWNAERDPDLPGYYVDVGQFDSLQHLTAPCLVFAGRGCGKTAQRQMLAAQWRPQNPGSPWLAIHYTFDGFEHVLGQTNEDVKQVRSIHHVNALLYLGLTTLLQGIAPEVAKAGGLASPEAASRLAGYVARFAPHLLPAWLTESPAALDQTNSQALLQGFVKLLKDAGLEACVVLVDGLDEFSLMATDPAQIVTFLAPLLGILPLIEGSDLVFKFFLPAELEPALRAQPWFRPDRLRLFRIAWDREGLLKLIEQRLVYFSLKEPSYQGLGQLCEDRLKKVIDKELVALAKGLPRAALILADMLLHYHCQRADPPELIALETWKKVKSEWQVRSADFATEEESPITQKQTTRLASPSLLLAAGDCPILRMEGKKGLIWLGKRDITSEVNPKEYRVLACLYKHRDELCTKDTLIHEAWPQDEQEGVTDQAVTASIARLRRVLRDISSGGDYVETVKGLGYRLHPAGFKAAKVES